MLPSKPLGIRERQGQKKFLFSRTIISNDDKLSSLGCNLPYLFRLFLKIPVRKCLIIWNIFLDFALLSHRVLGLLNSIGGFGLTYLNRVGQH